MKKYILISGLSLAVVAMAFTSGDRNELTPNVAHISDPKISTVFTEDGSLLTEMRKTDITSCVCSNWEPSPIQGHPDRVRRICGSTMGPAGCIQEADCAYCPARPDCGDCNDDPLTYPNEILLEK